MKVSVIIINFNTFDLTAQCIRSVISCTTGVGYELILVDNGSNERDPGAFLEHFPDIMLIRSPENLGFAGGNNLGLQAATGDILLLLNSDTILTEDSISKAARYLTDQPAIGVLGVSLRYPDGKVQHYTRRFRSISHELLDLVRPALYLMPYKKRAALLLNQYYNGDFDVAADWIGGAFFMFPKRILHLLPEHKLDDRFFMYGEDQLWCYQIKELGYQVFNYSGTSVIHIERASSRSPRRPVFNTDILERDLLIYRIQGSGQFAYSLLKSIYFSKKFIAYLIKLMIFKIQSTK